MSLVRPSTNTPISLPNSSSISARVAVGVLDRVVQQRRRDGRVVELQLGQDRGHFQRMREIRIARSALLLAMRLHRVDIGAVEQRLVGVRIVSPDPVDQFVLPHHLRLRGGFGFSGASVDAPRSNGARVRAGSAFGAIGGSTAPSSAPAGDANLKNHITAACRTCKVRPEG